MNRKIERIKKESFNLNEKANISTFESRAIDKKLVSLFIKAYGIAIKIYAEESYRAHGEGCVCLIEQENIADAKLFYCELDSLHSSNKIECAIRKFIGDCDFRKEIPVIIKIKNTNSVVTFFLDREPQSRRQKPVGFGVAVPL